MAGKSGWDGIGCWAFNFGLKIFTLIELALERRHRGTCVKNIMYVTLDFEIIHSVFLSVISNLFNIVHTSILY